MQPCCALLTLFWQELQRKRVRQISPDEIFDAVRSTMRRCKGGYASVMLINGVRATAMPP
jgi:glutamine phosphoribosylpyrophosphate amidotransferase